MVFIDIYIYLTNLKPHVRPYTNWCKMITIWSKCVNTHCNVSTSVTNGQNIYKPQLNSLKWSRNNKVLCFLIYDGKWWFFNRFMVFFQSRQRTFSNLHTSIQKNSIQIGRCLKSYVPYIPVYKHVRFFECPRESYF